MYLILVTQTRLCDEVFHHKLGHGTAADVAVTDEEDFYHVEVLIVELLNCCADAGLQAIVGFFVTKPTKLSKLDFQGWESGQLARFPAATRLRAAHASLLGFACFVGFVINELCVQN